MNQKTLTKNIVMIVMVVITIQSVFAIEVSEQKIHPELLDSNEEIQTVLVSVNFEQNIDIVSDIIELEGGIIKNKFKYGDLVVAEIPTNKLQILSSDIKIKKLNPDRTFHMTLSSSVPQINAPVMWNNGTNGTNVTIAILDTGIQSDHPSLIGKVIEEEVFTGEATPEDNNGHGTHVAGIAAGNGGSITGVAKGASLYNAKVLDSNGLGTESSIIAGINFAMDPDGNNLTNDSANIISMSLGGAFQDFNSPIIIAINDAIDAGAIVVVAAGNCGPGCPSSSCQGFIGVETPGISENAITVGAVDDTDLWACFSSGEILNGKVKPDVVAPGVNIFSSFIGSGYQTQSGTSMSTPHVAGAIALMIDANPGLNQYQVKDLLERTSKELGDPGKDIKYGSGRIDASKYLNENIIFLQNNRLIIPDTIFLDEDLLITLNTTEENLTNITANISMGNNTYQINLTNTTPNNFSGVFNNTNVTGYYNITVDVNGKSLSGSTFVFPVMLGQGVINSINHNPNIAFNDTLNITVDFENTGIGTLETFMELQIVEDGVIKESLESDFVNVTDNATFNFTWNASLFLGEKTIRAIAIFNGTFFLANSTLFIVDNDTPIITNITANDVYVQNPGLILVEVNDLSNISGNATVKSPNQQIEIVPLFQYDSTNLTKSLSATFENTDQTGTYTYNITLCDSVGFCNESYNHTFDVFACNDPKLLIVSEGSDAKPERYVNLLNSSYCISNWDKDFSINPSNNYLEKFESLIWTAGNFFDNTFDTSEGELLKNYTGDMLIEGPDIAFNLQFTEFLERMRVNFESDLILNETNVTILKTRNHPVFNSINETNFTYNISISPYPDSISPLEEGVELALWSEDNNSSIIISNDGSSKTIFFPFTLDAITYQDQIITNIIDWFYTSDTNADVVVTEIYYDYLIEGNNQFTVEVRNQGTISAINAAIESRIDSTLVDSQSVNLNPNETKNITFNQVLTPGFKNIRVDANVDFSILETNYINNRLTEEIRVATIEPDLVVNNITFNISENITTIITEIENIGGTNVVSAELEIFIDGGILETTFESVNFGEKINIFSNYNNVIGVHDVLSRINHDQTVSESNFSNNNLTEELYICNTSNIILIEDSDTEDFSTNNPSSISTFEEILKNNFYCYDLWNESILGVPQTTDIDPYELVIWSAGDYWNIVINESDEALIEMIDKPILFEGSEIGTDHENDSLMLFEIHGEHERDLILLNNTNMTFGSHEIGTGLTTITINNTLSPYPDSVLEVGSTRVANWSDANASILAFNDSIKPTVYFAFSIDAVINSNDRETLVVNSIEWLRPEPVTQISCGDTITEDTILTSDLNGCGEVGIKIGADSTKLDCNGHTINGTDSINSTGISTYYYSNVEIKNCKIQNFNFGIEAYQGNNFNIMNNEITNIFFYPISAFNVTNINVTDNLIYSNPFTSIDLRLAQNAKLLNNNMYQNNGGIFLLFSNDSLIINNTLNNSEGIQMSESKNNQINNNFILESIFYGIRLSSVSNNTIWNNTIINSTQNNSFEDSDSFGNSWNNSEIGNNWSDFESNLGYPYIYYIPGDGDGIDHKPIGGLTHPECGSNITQNHTLIFNITDCQNNGISIVSDDVKIDCNGLTIEGTGTGSGIEINGYNNIEIKNCKLNNFNTGILLNNTNLTNVTNNDITNSLYRGINTEDANQIIIQNNNFNSNTEAGIYLRSSNNNLVSKNNISNNTHDGFHLYQASNNVIKENIIYGLTGTGIYNEINSNFNNLTNNTIFDNIKDGIRIWTSNNVNITNNSIQNNSEQGIRLFDTNNNNLEYNQVINNNIDGIQLETANDNTISENTIKESNQAGIRLWTQNSGNNIMKNNIFINQNEGIFIRNSNLNIVSENTITNNTQGINITGTAILNLITFNNITNNSQNGIYVDATSNSINNNNFTNNTENARDDGLNNAWNTQSTGNYWGDFVDNSGYPSVYNIIGSAGAIDMYPFGRIEGTICGTTINSDFNLTNNLTNCTTNGLNIIGNDITIDCNGNTLVGNGTGTSNYGINLENSTNVTIQNCNIRDFEIGINLDNSDQNSVQNNNIENTNRGIYLGSSTTDNNIKNNTINNTELISIHIGSSSSTRNNIANNTLLNGVYGIRIFESELNIIENNIVEENFYGIYLFKGGNNTVNYNSLGNNADGLYFFESSFNNVSNNSMFNSSNYGIFQTSMSDNNIIYNNNLTNNSFYGVSTAGIGNLFYKNNFTDNFNTARDNGGPNFWNSSTEGNYWDDFSTNPGFPYIYEISGIANAIDFLPFGREDPLSCGTNVTANLTLFSDITNCAGSHGLAIKSSDVVVDCNGYKITGNAPQHYGIDAFNLNNIVVKNCEISGFSEGIHYSSIMNSDITNNVLYDNNYGVRLLNSDLNLINENNAYNNNDNFYDLNGFGNIFINNTASNGTFNGIIIVDSLVDMVKFNDVFENGDGIKIFSDSFGTFVENNTVYNNSFAGVQISSATIATQVLYNYIDSNQRGVYIKSGSYDNVIAFNNITNGSISGISIEDSNTNQILDNSIIDNGFFGIYNHFSNEGIFFNNDIFGHINYGMYLNNSYNNSVWNNTFNNSLNAYETVATGNNTWNDTEIGNNWSDFSLNPGYPYTYEISGAGSGVDGLPIGRQNPPDTGGGSPLVFKNEPVIEAEFP